MIQCFTAGLSERKMQKYTETVAAKTRIFLTGNKSEQATVRAQPCYQAQFDHYHIYTVHEI